MSNSSEWAGHATPEAMTAWTNPTPHEQSIAVSVAAHIPRSAIDETGVKRNWVQTTEVKTIVWAPKETKAIPSKYDRVIHIVFDCGHDRCRRAICRDPMTAGPRAKVVGGAAPLLQREGQKYSIDASLIARPEPTRSMSVAPADVAARLAAPDESEDPAIARARARRKAAGQ